MADSANYSRRDFIRRSAGAATAGGVAGVLAAATASRAFGANSRLRIGFLGTGARAQAHIDTVLKLQASGRNIEPVAVCDVFTKNRENSAERIGRKGTRELLVTSDYREVLADRDIDTVVISTPDHWHARMTTDALAAGKHVYCERPMTHTLAEATSVLAAWRASGRVMQVGCQRTSDGRWRAAHDYVTAGKIGKVVQAQSEYFRNSAGGQYRAAGLSRDMTPKNVNWPMFLGTEFGLAPPMEFDRALFAQWRCYWPFGSGMFADLFVPRLTELSLALGVRYPRKVIASGGIYLEYDGREVPDTATLIADYDEGLQVLVTATMANDHPIEHAIRGHYGTLRFDLSRDGFDFLPQRPQYTRLRDVKPEHIAAAKPTDETRAHWENFLEAIERGDPAHCHNPPDLGAAAVTTAALAVESYRQGKVCEWDAQATRPVDGGHEFARGWEQLSRERAEPKHMPGWQPDATFQSRQKPPDYQKLAGPWSQGIDPAT
jgi:predicted dehydrogenase